MSLSSTLLILACVFNTIYSQTITATTTNSTGTYFIASSYYNSFQYYRYGSITCTASYCYIVCDAPSGCLGLNVYATSSSTTLIIQCLSSSSCYNATISGNTTDQLNVHCNAPSSCYTATIIGNTTDQLNVHCNASYSCFNATIIGNTTDQLNVHCDALYSCSYATIIANTTDQLNVHCDNVFSCGYSNISCPYHKRDACDIDCGPYTYSCSYMNIYVPSTYTYNYLDITCPSSSSYYACFDVKVSCTDSIKSGAVLSWDYTDNEMSCSSSYSSTKYCCPYFTSSGLSAESILAIVGGVIGGIILLCIVIAVCAVCQNKQRRARLAQTPAVITPAPIQPKPAVISRPITAAPQTVIAPNNNLPIVYVTPSGQIISNPGNVQYVTANGQVIQPNVTPSVPGAAQTGYNASAPLSVASVSSPSGPTATSAPGLDDDNDDTARPSYDSQKGAIKNI